MSAHERTINKDKNIRKNIGVFSRTKSQKKLLAQL